LKTSGNYLINNRFTGQHQWNHWSRCSGIRTPLTLLLGPFEHALEKAKGNDVVFDPVEFESIYRNALRLLKLVNSILDFSRMEAGRMVASFEPVDLADYTKVLASQFRSVMEKGDLKLEVTAESLSEPIYVYIHRFYSIYEFYIKNKS